jgi:hypothetical protein
LFCIVWESQLNNYDRAIDHQKFRIDPHDDECLCPAGKTTPCHARKARESPQAIVDRFFRTLRNNLPELSKCPFCQYDTGRMYNFKDCLDQKNVNKLIRHFNMAHGYELAEL